MDPRPWHGPTRRTGPARCISVPRVTTKGPGSVLYMLALRRLQGASLSPRALRLWAVYVIPSEWPSPDSPGGDCALPGSLRTGAAPRTTPRGSATRGSSLPRLWDWGIATRWAYAWDWGIVPRCSSWLSRRGTSRGLGDRDALRTFSQRLRYACVVFLNNNCNFWASGP